MKKRFQPKTIVGQFIFALMQGMHNFEGISLILTFDPKHLSCGKLNWMFNQENDFVMTKSHDFHFPPQNNPLKLNNFNDG